MYPIIGLGLCGTFLFSILGTNYLAETYRQRENNRPAYRALAWSRLWYWWAIISGGATAFALLATR